MTSPARQRADARSPMNPAQGTIAQKLAGLRAAPRSQKPKGPLTRVPRAGNSVPGQQIRTASRKPRREF